MNIIQEAFSYLGIDWGEKKIGVAIADSETQIAFALETVPNNERALARFASIIAEYHVREVVIGIPSHVNRECVEYPGESFGKVFSDEFHLVVHFENEMFTTKLARADLIARGVRGRLDDLDDAQAARIILASWLEKFGRL